MNGASSDEPSKYRALQEEVKYGSPERVRDMVAGMSRAELVKAVGPVFPVAHGTAMVEFLLASGLDVNTLSSRGQSRLYFSAGMNDLEEIDLLLRWGADPNLPGSDGDTPLFGADLGEAMEAVYALVNGGADVDAQSNDGDTTLHRAAGNGRVHIVRALLERSATTELRNKRGETPLIAANGLRDECRDNGAQIAQLLIEHGANVHAANHLGQQAMHYAAHHGYDDVLTVLFQAGADPDAMTKDGCSVLDYCTEESTFHLLLRFRREKKTGQC
jgi:uncharacterized protein